MPFLGILAAAVVTATSSGAWEHGSMGGACDPWDDAPCPLQPSVPHSNRRSSADDGTYMPRIDVFE